MPKDSPLHSRDAVKTLEELMQVTAGIVEAFESLSVPAG